MRAIKRPDEAIHRMREDLKNTAHRRKYPRIRRDDLQNLLRYVDQIEEEHIRHHFKAPESNDATDRRFCAKCGMYLTHTYHRVA